MIKKIIKKIPFLYIIAKIIMDKRYFYHFLQGLVKKRSSRVYLARLESKYFGKRINISQKEYLEEYFSLQKLGVILNPIKIDGKTIMSIKSYLEGKRCYDPDNNIKGIDALHPPSNTMRAFYKNEDISSAPGVMHIANNKKILKLVSNYFSATPKIDSIWAWWAYPNEGTPPTQYYHRDIDTLNFLKFFIYLTDVDSQSGPHMIIKSSHNDISFLTKKDKMHHDKEITEHFSQNDTLEITGEAGYCFLADLFALHKGKIPEKSPRLVLQIIYSIVQTPFGPKRPYLAKKNTDIALNDEYSNYTNSNIIID